MSFQLIFVAAIVTSIFSTASLAAPGDLTWSVPDQGYNVGSSPAVGVAGFIYVGGADGTVYTLNTGGGPGWLYDTGGVISGSPAIGADGTTYVGSFDGYLYALDLSGILKWRYKTNGPIYSSPAIAADGTIYVGSAGQRLHAVHPDGHPIWSRIVGGEIGSAPAIGPDGSIYVGDSGGSVTAFNPAGVELWTFTTGGGVASPAVGIGGRIYVGSFDQNVYALNPNGTVQWTYNAGGRVASAPAAAADGTVYVGVYDTGQMLSLTYKGALNWTYEAGAPVYSSPAIGANGRIYVGSEDGVMHAVGPTGLSDWTFTADSSVLSSPVLSDNSVFFASKAGTVYKVESGTTLGPSLWPMFGQSRRHQRRSTDPDSDGDGLLDSWEIFYAASGLDPNNPNDALNDSDRDRMTSLEEFAAGTDPTIPNDPTSGNELVVVRGDVAPLGFPDGSVTVADGALAMRLLTDPTLMNSLSVLGQIQTEYGLDANQDGTFSNSDAVWIVRRAAGFSP